MLSLQPPRGRGMLSNWVCKVALACVPGYFHSDSQDDCLLGVSPLLLLPGMVLAGEAGVKKIAKAVDAALSSIATGILAKLQSQLQSLLTLAGLLHGLLLCEGYFNGIGLQVGAFLVVMVPCLAHLSDVMPCQLVL